MKTLQEQYNLIKEGRGNKEILLKTAKQLYPDVVPNHFTYNQAIPLLKQRGLLHESIGGVITKGTDPDWFVIFRKNTNKLNESIDYSEMSDPELIELVNNEGMEEMIVLDGEGGLANRDEIIDLLKDQDRIDSYNQQEKDIEQYGMGYLRHLTEAKAVEKKPTKEVVDMETKGYDYKNKENIDNIYGQAFLIGYYAEMKDPANADKTVDGLKAIVAKNLYKDPLYYVKNGQFGVKGVGYTDDIPGLKLSKTDQMIPVPDQVKPRASKTDLGDKEKKTGAAKGIKGEMTITPKSSRGIKKMPLPGKEKKVKLQENNIRSLISKLIKEELEEAWDTMGQGYGEEGMYSSEEKWNSLTPDEQEELLMTFIKDPDEAVKYVGADFSMLPDVVIANMDTYFLNEVTYQMGTNFGSFSGGNKGDGEGGDRKIPRVLFLPKSAIEAINNLQPGSIKLISKDKYIYMYVSDMFVNAMNELERGRTSYEKESKKSSLSRLISDKIPSAVRSKIKKETNPKKDTGLNMHYVNLLLANNKDRTGYWILLKVEFDPLMREEEKGAVELPKTTSPSDVKKYTEQDIDVKLTEDEDLDYNPEMFDDVYYQQIEDLEQQLATTTDPERAEELQRKIDYLMKNIM